MFEIFFIFGLTSIFLFWTQYYTLPYPQTKGNRIIEPKIIHVLAKSSTDVHDWMSGKMPQPTFDGFINPDGFSKAISCTNWCQIFQFIFFGNCIPLESKMTCRSCSWLHFKFVNKHCQGNLSVWSANRPVQWKYKPFLTFRCNELPSAIGKFLIYDYVAWMIVKVRVRTGPGI